MPLNSMSSVDDIFNAAGAQYGIDPDWGRAIAQVESGNSNTDKYGKPIVSFAGAKGRMQLMDDTAAGLKVTDPYDDRQSIPGAFSLLNTSLKNNNDDTVTALREYQGGPDRSKWGKANTAYAPAVIAAYNQIKAAKGQPPTVPASASVPAKDPGTRALEDELFSAPPAASASAAPAPAAAAPASPVSSQSDDHKALEAELFSTADSGGAMSKEMLASGKDAYGHPLQYMGPTPQNDPVGQATGKPISGNQLPGPMVQAAASLPTDPAQRRRVVAAQLFPNLSPQAAQSRVFQGDDGRLAAVGLDGKPFYVDPAPLRKDLSPSNLLATGASLAGPAIPAVAGTVAGVAAAPTSLVAGPIVAGAGAAAGDVARQYAARQLDPQPELSRYSPTQTAIEAGGAALGQGGGALLVRGVSPNRLAASSLDVNRLRAGAVLPEADRIAAQAQAQGVTLTPGQASNLPSLLGHEDAISSGSAGPGLSDIAKNFYQRQGQQLQVAGQNMLDRVSPVADKTDAAMQFQQGAEDATRAARQDANAAARPHYDAAQQAGQVMTPDLAQLAETPGVSAAMTRARVEYANLYRRPAPDTPDFALWDLTKRQLDDGVGVARRAGENTTAGSLDSLRGDLVQHLDAAYPSYATARATSAPGQRLAARLDESVGGAVGDGTEKAKAIVAPVFEGNNPRAISEARDAFTSAGRADEWNAGVRAYIQNAFDKAAQSQGGLNPAMLRRQVWGNVDNRQAIAAAMDPNAYRGFENFMGTVEATARTYPMNSLTTPRAEARNALLGAAGDSIGVRAAEAAGAAMNPFKLAQVGNVVPQQIASYLRGRNLQNIAERLFSPDGMTYLRSMGNLSPGSQQAITATSEFLGQTGARAAAANANAEPNRLIGSPAAR